VAQSQVSLPVVGLGATQRRDLWWVEPLVTLVVYTAFIVYATFRGLEGANYILAGTPYLAPFYSPLFENPWVSPAILILWAPAGFRVTCYYYRKSYYRAFTFDPPACAVSERPGRSYHGETRVLVLQNLHRFFFYVAVLFVFIFLYDAIRAFFWSDGVHVGIGTLLLVNNAVWLGLYTFSCHAGRHLVGGGLDSFEGAALGGVRRSCWRAVSCLNRRHGFYAWVSLFGVVVADLYIRAVCAETVSLQFDRLF
jgi:hypothetical protein